MENEQLDQPTGMALNPPPLVYLHEHFKKNNIAGSNNLKNNWVWYSTKDLQEIIKMIEAIKGDGVRLYYGIYNDKVCDFLTKVSKKKDQNNYRDYGDHQGHNTVFFVPTYGGNLDDEHIDNISLETVKEFRDNYEKGLDLPEPLVGGFNVGNICPPPFPPGGNCDHSGSNL